MPDAATLRQREAGVDAAYVLAIDGIPYMFATEHFGGGLFGSGASSWIGVFEAATSHETTGQRTVLPGLEMPNVLPRGRLNPNTGMPETTQARFRIADYDGTLRTLFGTEGKTWDFIGERIGPAQAGPLDPDALGSSILLDDGSSTNPRGQNIGLERIGPNGERRHFHAFPFQGVGLDHPRPVIRTNDSPDPDRISADPLDFAGRLVTVWRVHRDMSETNTGFTTWTQWDDAWRAGDLVFVGKMSDRGEIVGDSMWEIVCDGIEAPLKRRLGSQIHSK